MYGRAKQNQKKRKGKQNLGSVFSPQAYQRVFFWPVLSFFLLQGKLRVISRLAEGSGKKKFLALIPPFCFGRYNRGGVHPNQPMEEGKEERGGGGGGGGGGSDRSSGDQLHGKEKEGKGKMEERCGIGQSWWNEICIEQVK